MTHLDKDEDLFGRTWKTVVVLVGASVVFVGALSTIAVVVTDRAVSPKAPASVEETPDTKSDAKPGKGVTTPAKKPVSI